MREIGKTTLLLLSESRLAEAVALLAAAYPSGAYYLAGYAVELRLKAMIADRFSASAIPDLAEVKKVYTHDLNALVALARLSNALAAALRNTNFSANWSVVREWDEQSRYRETDMRSATALVLAISDPADGVMAWLATS